MASIAVQPATPADQNRAQCLSRELNLPLLEQGSDLTKQTALQAALHVAGKSLSLRQTGPGAPGPVAVDFGAGTMRHRRRGGNNELLGRAVGVGKKTPLRVLDATAGLARDAFVLADLGCQVHLCERHPVIAALIASGMACALDGEDPWLRDVVSRMRLFTGDARELSDLPAQSDVIYLDPMFPLRDKRAAVKKEMALFQLLLDSAPEAAAQDDLLDWACTQPVARVVQKRPLKAPVVGREPSHCIRGRAVRYDVYVLRSLS